MASDDRKAEKARRKAAEDFEGNRLAQEKRLKDFEREFWAAPFGQARAAKIAGDRYFQIELALDASTRSAAATSTIGTTSLKYTGHGRTISEIEAEGWDFVQAGFVFKETGSVSRDKFLSSGQQVSTTGITVGVYLFKATDRNPRTDEVWKVWAESSGESG